ncbi:NAD(P)/FAD-dependent oxidoreductase [Tianweitania sp. BSSL-BM11]|uniref:Thioredoxin reductase n=1 Tax=Tianweitania aestuarii TaxID=2814886 RepID=A0ABS5RWU8_9HYPH|nr:NAD(P)/FAD-dependent oxidoreductase [Tianweitania aestuarii]MBS9721533.1 NAD(P)/FAD-dependent oxidoreductase [Tianweitania aestuarii]
MHHDAIIIGGSFAGLSAAMYIARARRSVRIIDAGLPRNRFAAQSHGFFGQDGSEPGAMLDKARAQVAAYPTVRITDGRALSANKNEDGFAVTLESGEQLQASRMVLAYGISDELPALPGLAERWGHTVIHCPYCHGFEFGGRRLGVLYSTPMSLHQAHLVTEWGPTTLYLNGAELDPAAAANLQARGVRIEPARLISLHGEGKGLSAMELADGRMDPIDALFVGPLMRANSDIADQLGCAMDDHPLGQIIHTDEMKQTSVPGVFAAGDIARGAHSVTWASADGVMAGVALHRSLVF